MKRFIVIYFFPLVFAMLAVYLFAINHQANDFLFRKKTVDSVYRVMPLYISNFEKKASLANDFLKSSDSAETIFLLGSSELSNSTEAIPYNFISKRFKTQVIGVGHAGNQCLSIYAQLLANEQRLEHAPIVIVVSPGWFESRASKGTSSEVFLEYVSEKYLNQILNDKSSSEFDAYLFSRIAGFYEEFSSPCLEMKIMNFKNGASKSFIHKILYSPLIYNDYLMLSLKKLIMSQLKSENSSINRHPIIPEAVSINWDSLLIASKAEVLKKSTNNTMGISDDYFNQYINSDKGGHIEAVYVGYNQELEDFRMLMKLLKEKNVNARIIISPLNSLYFKNLSSIFPTMRLIETEVKNSGFDYLDLFEKDKTKYDKAMLNDIMHISDYCWYKIDRFIIETYKLSK
jgi:D-alanyl-lipoteichoic acid biosynthesis protein DltD